MNEELVKKLLKTKNRFEFLKEMPKDRDYFSDCDLWDERVITHVMKICDLSREQFEWGFTKTPPEDYFNE